MRRIQIIFLHNAMLYENSLQNILHLSSLVLANVVLKNPPTTMMILIKPKFHYADFVRQTLSQTQIMKVRDTNHVADFHDLCHRLS